jgi:AcrR family transcriptional regulator
MGLSDPGDRLPKQRPGLPGGKRDENRRMKQQLLFRAATELFKKNGIESVTIDDIVAGAGISKGSFYSYFTDKAELVRLLYEPLGQELEQALEEAKVRMQKAEGEDALFSAYQEMATRMAQACLNVPDLILIYLAESRGAPTQARQPVIKLSQQMMHHALELTKIAQERRLLKPCDPYISSLAVIGAIERLLFEYLRETIPHHPLELIASLITLVLDGLRENPSASPASS